MHLGYGVRPFSSFAVAVVADFSDSSWATALAIGSGVPSSSTDNRTPAQFLSCFPTHAVERR